nr:regulator of epidermal growth factor receptor [Cryptomonas curvata]
MLGYKNQELDLLLFFYLQECGYHHSAFTFSHESNLNFSEEINQIIPPGLLVSIYQRGLLYSEIEAIFPQSCFDNPRSPVLDFLCEKKKNLSLNFNFVKNICFEKIITFFNQDSIQCYVWHSRKFAIYLSTFDSKICRWKIFNFKTLTNLSNFYSFTKLYQYFGEKSVKNEITNIDFNLNGTLLTTTTYDGYINFWCESGKFLKNFFFKYSRIEEIKWSENSRFIVISCLSGKITIFSSWYFQILNEIYIYNLNFIKIKWITVTNLLFSTTKHIFGILSLPIKKICGIFSHSSKICDLDLFISQKLICSCSEKGKLRIWLHKFELIMLYEIKAHFKEISGIKWKPNSLCYSLNYKKIKKKLFILSISLDCSVKIWNLLTQKCIFSFRHKTPVISLNWNLYEKKFIIGLSSGLLIHIDFKNKKFFEKKTGKFGIFDITSHSMSRVFSFVSSNRLMCI